MTGSAEWIVGLITKATDEIQRIENLFYEYEQARASHPDGQ
ncbi:MAG: hypothetical protein OWU32_11615 [Firmicutes bacterium]|nr:hypothetical protein [Bacillota bacterium]